MTSKVSTRQEQSFPEKKVYEGVYTPSYTFFSGFSVGKYPRNMSILHFNESVLKFPLGEVER